MAVAPALESIAYAKSPAHERFVKGFSGQLKGRYNTAFLVGAGLLGGAELRASIEAELGHPKWPLDDFVSVRDAIVILDRSVRAGVSAEKLGELVFPAYKRAKPEMFEGKTVLDAFQILETAYRTDTTYGGVSPGHVAGQGRATVYRKDSPLPCAYFVGVLRGLLQVFGARGEAREVDCQWEGARSCAYTATWR